MNVLKPRSWLAPNGLSVKNLTASEKRIFEYCQARRASAKSDAVLAKLIANYLDFLKTISELRTETIGLKERLAGLHEMYKAKCDAYQISCQERVKMLSENKFLREQLERLK